MIERIVDRMIDAAGFALAAVADVERCNSEMLEERRVIGTGTERINANIGPFACLSTHIGVAVQNASSAPAFGDGNFFLGKPRIVESTEPLSPIAPLSKSFAKGEAICALTEAEPADSPAIVTRFGSPPKAAA